jgi:hypothetical protein
LLDALGYLFLRRLVAVRGVEDAIELGDLAY